MRTVRVSVIMPFFNAEAFIAEAIESVVSQSYHDWELLLIDDGSSDHSRSIACRYARQLPTRVRVLQHSGGANRGAAESRNLGIRSASADLIAFLDADDVWLPDSCVSRSTSCCATRKSEWSTGLPCTGRVGPTPLRLRTIT
jgi:glycosyltransferase involved in cell wall biosynthesis